LFHRFKNVLNTFGETRNIMNSLILKRCLWVWDGVPTANPSAVSNSKFGNQPSKTKITTIAYCLTGAKFLTHLKNFLIF